MNYNLNGNNINSNIIIKKNINNKNISLNNNNNNNNKMELEKILVGGKDGAPEPTRQGLGFACSNFWSTLPFALDVT